MKSKLTNGMINGMIAFAGFFILTSIAHAQGTLLKKDTLPVISAVGVGIEADCDGNLYYTNEAGCDNHLYKIDMNGKLLSTVLLVDTTGASVSIGAISWDNNRQMLWGGSQCDYTPNRVYLIDPATGLSKYKFTSHTSGLSIDDGIAYDPTDSSIWIAPDVAHFIDHIKEDGTYLGTLTPALPGSVCSSCAISGVIVGVGDRLYLGLDGEGIIVQIKKSDGSYISSFYSPGGRDEDLACDPVNFYPKLAIWSRDAYNGTISAIEVDSQTCVCGAATLPPVADFESGNTTGCVSDCFNFTDLSTNATSWLWRFPGAAVSTSTAQNPQGICYQTAGTYNVTLIASNAGGEDSVTFTNYIKVTAGSPMPLITQHHDTLYCSTDPSYTSYQWSFDSTIIAGATNTLLVICDSGIYSVKVTNENGCEMVVGINVTVNCPNGINEYSQNNIISLSPNPATDELVISGNWQSAPGKKMITIFNTLGQIVYVEELNSKSEIINCKPFSAGIYFVLVITEQERWKGRFVKE